MTTELPLSTNDEAIRFLMREQGRKERMNEVKEPYQNTKLKQKKIEIE